MSEVRRRSRLDLKLINFDNICYLKIVFFLIHTLILNFLLSSSVLISPPTFLNIASPPKIEILKQKNVQEIIFFLSIELWMLVPCLRL